MGKETIKLGNAEITADKIIVADRRAVNATPTQLTIGEKYRADRAARDAEKAKKRHEDAMRQPLSRGEFAQVFNRLGQVVDSKAMLLGNVVFMVNTLLEYLTERGLPVHVGAADDADGGNVLVNRMRKDDWDSYYNGKMAAENARLAEVQRKQQIANVDVEGWLKLPGHGKRVTDDPAREIPPTAVLLRADGPDEEFTAPTMQEAVFMAMEWEYNQEQEKAKAAAKAATDALAEKSDPCASCHDPKACEKNCGPFNGPPCAGQDAVAPKVVE